MRLAIATCALLLTPAFAHADKLSGSAPSRHVLQGQEVSVYNIAGKLVVVPGTGSAVVVEVTPGGRDAARLSVKETTVEGHPALRVVYPENDIVYPEVGSGSRHSVTTETFPDGEKRRLRITGSGPGLEAHADIRVSVPRGKRVNLYLTVGKTSITDVVGDIAFDGASSAVDVTGHSGTLSVDSGSGTIHVSRSKGMVSIEAGSGGIEISDVDGSVSAEAGSGAVVLTHIDGEKITASAGSGSVTGSDLRASILTADAGSGEVDLDGASADKMSVDAGSGTIRVRLLENVDDLHIDVGSGSVTLKAPPDLSANVRIECETRRLTVDFPIEIERQDHDVTIGRIGGSKGRITIDAGSGSVRLTRI